MSTRQSDPTLVSFGNFASNVQAKELAEFLEQEVGLVLRCKIKKVLGNTPPHAFVHFESPRVAKEAIKLADKGRLLLRGEWPLVARMDDRAWVNGRRGLNSKVYSHIQLVDVTLELGSVTGAKKMLVSWNGPKRGPVFRIEPAGKRLRFFFNQELELKKCSGEVKSKKTRCDVLMEVRLQEVKRVQEVEREVSPVLLLQLLSPPWIFYRTAEDDIYEYDCDPSQLADDEDPWIRCLDIITPSKSIGRCLDYMLTVSPRQKTAFMKVITYFRDNNVLQRSVQSAYSLCTETKSKGSVHDYFSTVVTQEKTVPFDLMFLVNSLVHQGIVHVSNLSPSFYQWLRPDVTSVDVSSFALRHLLTSREPIFEAAKSLESVIRRAANESALAKEPVLDEGSMVVRRLIITPTLALCLPPEVEISNRVLRHFTRLSDRFLRVSFLDENILSVSPASLSVQVAPIVRQLSSVGTYNRTDVYDRIMSIMMEGFTLCGRHYCFLAYSAGQLREGSAWFFAGDGQIGVNEIRRWMGNFPKGNVAKHAARMGQCFSATVSTLQVLQSEQLNLPDIKRNGYDFSDGCGKIDPSFAQLVAKVLKLEDNPPSAYQIRYAGYKGVVAVWPIEGSPGKSYKLALRDSMKKFFSNHCQLEIVGWSKFLPLFLNRQIITLLSTLDVKDDVFVKLQETMVRKLNHMVQDRDLAYSVLMLTCSGDSYSRPLRMLCAGFDPRREAHLRAMLVAIRAGQLEELVQKTRIFVPKGRWLLGCLDETAILEYGECFLRVSDPPKGIIGEERQSVVIKGWVVMTKNPCMHPGDIRILKAVDVPALYHLVDCLVVPQNGPRPHPNEASGSDLDGDVYFVSWDETLIPSSGKSEDPMDYVAPVQKDARNTLDVKIEHVVEFFVKHMVNDSLGKICNAHVVHADLSPKGAKDEKCLYLSELAAKAVDYPKTGKAAIMPFDLKPTRYPDFMEKEEAITYRSEKIIGLLYRKVQGILPKESEALQLKGPDNTSPISQIADPEYDPDLEVDGFDAYLEEAWATKQSYDRRLQAIMSQFNIASECEVVTGHVMVGAKNNSRRQGDVKERVKLAYLALQKEYLNLLVNDCMESGQEKSFEVPFDGLSEKNQARASAWYYVTYHREWYEKAPERLSKLDVNRARFLSFPWVAVDQLVALKIKKVKSRRFLMDQKSVTLHRKT